jgi:hypothetical protein
VAQSRIIRAKAVAPGGVRWFMEWLSCRRFSVHQAYWRNGYSRKLTGIGLAAHRIAISLVDCCDAL